MTMERAGAIVDATIAARTRRSMIVSVVVHIVGVALWIVIARPTIPDRAPTQVVRSVKLNRANTPEPSTPEPEPPEPEPEPEPEPPEPEPEPLKKRDKKNSPPPPPPPECKNCAMTSDLTPDDVNPSDTANAIPMGVPGGVPGGVLGGVPGGVVGGVIGGTGTELPAGPRAPLAPPEKKKRRSNIRPIGSIMAHAMFTPDPDPRQLAATKAGRGERESGFSKVKFCVDKNGRTTDIRVVRKYPGDPGVDRICRQAVTKWRFKPFFSNGEKVVVCTTMKFEIVFE